MNFELLFLAHLVANCQIVLSLTGIGGRLTHFRLVRCTFTSIAVLPRNSKSISIYHTKVQGYEVHLIHFDSRRN